MLADSQRANVSITIVNRKRLPERRFLRRREIEDAERRDQRDGDSSTDSGCGQHWRSRSFRAERATTVVGKHHNKQTTIRQGANNRWKSNAMEIKV